MNVTMVKTQAVKFNRARNNLLAVVAFTALNLLLITFEFNLNFLFSAFVPQILLIFLGGFSPAFGLIVGFAAVSIYVVCYALSKRWRVFILIAFILFAIDSLIMLGFMVITGYFAEFIFDIVFHAWVWFYLITGVIAWAKLSGVTADEFKALQEAVVEETQTEELNSALNVIAPNTAEETLPQSENIVQPAVQQAEDSDDVYDDEAYDDSDEDYDDDGDED